MLRALGHPVTLLGLVVGFLLAVAAAAGAQALLGGRSGRATPHRPRDAARLLDPYGAVAAIVGGAGWGATRPANARSRGARIAAYLAGPVAAVAVAAVLLVGYVAAGGARIFLAVLTVGNVLTGVQLPAEQTVLLCGGLEAAAVAVLMLVPLPPLPGWRIACELVSPSPGWQRARYQLEDRNIGAAILLVVAVFPPGGAGPILLRIVDGIVGTVLGAV